MSVVLYERVSSRPLKVGAGSTSLTAKFLALGSSSETEVYNAAILDTPRTYFGLYRDEVSVSPIDGSNSWDVEVNYTAKPSESTLGETPSAPEVPESGGAIPRSISFKTNGGTTKIKQALSTISTTVAGGGAAPDHKGGIGVTREGVEGIDIVSPNLSWSIEVPRAFIDIAYWLTLGELTGTMNSALFWGHQAGELLYEGCSGKDNGTHFTLTHEFSVSKNRANIVVSDQITVPVKLGWDYLDVSYIEEVDVGFRRYRPHFARVLRLYRSENFQRLEIGGGG